VPGPHQSLGKGERLTPVMEWPGLGNHVHFAVPNGGDYGNLNGGPPAPASGSLAECAAQ
jgi:hypothetical protein